MKAYLILVTNNGTVELDQQVWCEGNNAETMAIVQRERRDLVKMDCGTISVVECDHEQVQGIEDYIQEKGKFGRKALMNFTGARFI